MNRKMELREINTEETRLRGRCILADIGQIAATRRSPMLVLCVSQMWFPGDCADVRMLARFIR